MNPDRFNQFIACADADGIVFYHSGRLDEETIASIGALLRHRLQEEGANGIQSRKVFTIFMEMAQNIVHYAVAEEGEAAPAGKYGALSVARSDEGFEVMCGNYVATEQVPRVRGRLEAVRVLGPDKVRLAYRQQLAFEGEDLGSKGAGLGFLTMAASAKKPIEFAFDPHPASAHGSTFLFLKAVI
jgi:Family of unknown function (DUF6272)